MADAVKQRNFTCTDSMWSRAIARAKKEDRSVASLVRLALRVYLDHAEEEDRLAEYDG